MKKELTYNGYSEIKENKIIFYELVNYGYIENNFSEIIRREYNLKNYSFISEFTYRNKNTPFFKKVIETYLELSRVENENNHR